jgi:hypothetical protein
MNFSFYIFGTPRKFEIYPNTKIKYFKGFNQSSRENEKMIIQRFENGQVFYSYINYDLVSNGFEQGAFFGMAVVFKGKYCVDVQKLYQLLKSAYESILQSNVLLRKTDKIYFSVSSFDDAMAEIKRIKTDVCTSLNDKLSDDDFTPVTDTFKEIKRKTIKSLNIDKGNTEILKNLKRYNLISVSSEYSESEIAAEPITLKPQEKENNTKEESSQNNNGISVSDTKTEKTETAFDRCNIILSVIVVLLLLAVIFIIIHKAI